MQAANRVAINTIVQYIQLLLNVLIGLYSVRIILNALGASDYGTYDLIAGVVALLSFISTSLSQTSMRYLAVSLGSQDDNKTKKTFSICLWLHIYIALLLAGVLIILGFFLFDGFLVIPTERVTTARVVYYLMILSLFLNISVTPFTALVAAHERFIFISCIQIVDSVCKLGIAFLISAFSRDRLLLYGILMVGIIVLNVFCYIFYSYIEFRHKMSVRRASISEMKGVTNFAGWTLLDVLGSVATRQGYAILLNSFFGTIVNAVFALSRQIEGHMFTISSSVINTMKPQIMKSQGAGDESRMFRLSLTAGKFGFSMMSLIAVPVLVMMPELLTLWLKEVPQGTVLFSRLMIIACMIEQLTRGLVYANQAVGNIKWFSISISLIRFTALPISWLFFHFGAPSYVAIVIFLVCESIGSFSRVIVLSRISDFKASSFASSVLLPLLTPFLVSLAICIVSYHYLNGIWGLLAVCVISATSYAFILFFFGLTVEERNTICRLIFSATRGRIKLNTND